MRVLGSLALVTLVLVAPLGTIRRVGYVVVISQQVPDDLMAVAQEVQISGRLGGDVLVVADRLSITGTVEGDVVGFVREASIEGEVAGSVRLSGGIVAITGRVAGDVTSAVVRLRIEGEVDRDVYGLAGDMDLKGSVGRDVAGRVARTVIISGRVGRDVEPVTPLIRIQDGASVGGTVVVWPGSEAIIADGAELGSITRRRTVAGPLEIRAMLLMVRVVVAVLSLLAGLAVFWLFPRSLERAERRLRSRPLGTAAIGLLVVSIPLGLAATTAAVAALAPILVALPMLALLVPLSLVAGIVVLFVAALAPVPMLTVVGRLIPGSRSPLAGFVLGGIVFWVLLAVPILGGWVALGVVLVGSGAWATGAWSARGDPAWALSKQVRSRTQRRGTV